MKSVHVDVITNLENELCILKPPIIKQIRSHKNIIFEDEVKLLYCKCFSSVCEKMAGIIATRFSTIS
jgi:hypothetical protein